MTSLTNFVFKDKGIRAMIKNWELFAIAKDVCEALEISWAWERTLKSIPTEWRGVGQIATPWNIQDTMLINEQWIYRLVFKSKKKTAVEFQNFMAGIAVRLRKWESVSLQSKTPAQALLESVQQIVKHEQEILELQTRQDIIESKLNNRSED